MATGCMNTLTYLALYTSKVNKMNIKYEYAHVTLEIDCEVYNLCQIT
jgi:hypothetical protein